MGRRFNGPAFHLREASGIGFGKIVLELADGLLHPEPDYSDNSNGRGLGGKTGPGWGLCVLFQNPANLFTPLSGRRNTISPIITVHSKE